LTRAVRRSSLADMQKLTLGKSGLSTSRIGYGCMPLGGGWDEAPLSDAAVEKTRYAIDAAQKCGIDLFDHADIYCRGKSEEAFGAVLAKRPSLRDRIVIQSKCGICLPGEGRDFTVYDFRRAYIVGAVEQSLRRLRTDRLDVLLLHRPDPLCEPEEVSAAWDDLARSGKVRFFGVSNHSAAQIALLARHVSVPIVANQLELNIVHSALLDQGVRVNQREMATDVTGTLEYCRLHGITIQAWGPLANGYLTGRKIAADHPYAARLASAAKAVAAIAKRRDVSREAVCIAWLLRHPARIQPVLGTTDPARIAACAEADGFELSRDEWYGLFIAGRGARMP
jgi:predicted oxidoreductase